MSEVLNLLRYGFTGEDAYVFSFHRSMGEITESWILLVTYSTVNIFSNGIMLHNIR